MGEDCLFSLVFMNIYYEFEVNIEKVIEEFKKRSNCYFFLRSLLFDEL